MMNNTGTNMMNNPFHRYFQMAEALTLENSVHKLIQTQFFPTCGIYRGTSRAFESTALAYVKGSTDITVPANGTAMTLIMVPTNAAGAANFIAYNTAVSVSIPNPIGTGATSVQGPYFVNNPATSFKVVLATLQIYPEGAALNQSGAGQMFYTTDINGVLGAFNQSAVDSLQVSRPWSGTQPIILHWTPNATEANLMATQPALQSGLGVYLKGLSAGSAFRIEYEVGFEYVPNATTTLIVEKCSSDIHPDTPFWISRVAQKHWIPLMLAPTVEYTRLLEEVQASRLLGGLSVGSAVTAMGTISSGNNVNNRVDNPEMEYPCYQGDTDNLYGENNSEFNRLVTNLNLEDNQASSAFSGALQFANTAANMAGDVASNYGSAAVGLAATPALRRIGRALASTVSRFGVGYNANSYQQMLRNVNNSGI